MRRRIDLIGPGPRTRGGIAQFNTELTRRLRDAGADAHIVAYRRTYPRFSRAGRQGPDPSVRRDAVPTTAALVPWFPWTWIRAARAIRRRAPEGLVVQWWHPITALSSWYVARRAKRLGTRVIFVCHNAWPHEGFPLAKALTHLALGQGDLLIALSTEVANELRQLEPNTAVSVIPHPSYSALISEAAEADREKWLSRIAPPANAKVVLFFGNVRPYKGLRDLLTAFRHVAAATPAVLVVAGTFFEPVESYRAQVEELGLGDSIRLLDEYVPDEDVGALFTLCDLVVLPYRSASQSGVVPLAAAYAKPVVATSVGGLPDSLGGTGALVPPKDPEALGFAIVEALRSPPPPPPRDDDLWERWRAAVLPP